MNRRLFFLISVQCSGFSGLLEHEAVEGFWVYKTPYQPGLTGEQIAIYAALGGNT